MTEEIRPKKRSIIKFAPSFRESMKENLGWSEEEIRRLEFDVIKSQKDLREGIEEKQ